MEWSKIKSDLDNLSEISFDRQAIGENVTLQVFLDAADDMYGFTVYGRSLIGGNYKTCLLFF